MIFASKRKVFDRMRLQAAGPAYHTGFAIESQPVSLFVCVG